MTLQATSLAGFAGGGLLVAAITPQGALAFDAVTFALSAVLLRRGLQDRPAAMDRQRAARSLLADATEGLRIVAADRRRYGPLLLGMVGAATLVVPEAIATASAHSLGYGAAVVGLIMAASRPARSSALSCWAGWSSESTRRKLMWPMALFSTLPMPGDGIRPGRDRQPAAAGRGRRGLDVPDRGQHVLRRRGAAARPAVGPSGSP